VTDDTKYGTVENIVAIEDAGLRAYIPLADLDKRSPFFGKQRFRYDAERDLYTCPGGADLLFLHDEYGPRITKYQADAATCNACPLKSKCTASDKGWSVSRSFDEDYLDRVRGYQTTEPYKKALRKRKVWVEPLFGEAKQWHGLERFRLRMLEKVNIEALVTASGQNLKRLLSWRGWGRRWFPGGAAGVVIPPDYGLFSMVPV
jgi:hypothetical protein